MTFVVTVLTMVSYWFIFVKMNHEGWEGIVPFYSSYVLFKELYGNGWKFLLLLIPLYNIYVIIKFDLDLGRAFGKNAGFGIGLLLLSPVFLCILAFDKSIVYQGRYC